MSYHDMYDMSNEEVKQRKSKVVSFWSCDSGMGVNTFAIACAVETARRGLRTALVELDTFHPATFVTLGMSHHTRNFETWVSKSQESDQYRAIREYLVNSNIWLQEMGKDNRMISDAVSELPSELYVLAPSKYMDRFQARNVKLKPTMPAFIIDELENLGFEAIFFDVPSELLNPVTGPTLKLSDEIFVLLDGHVSHCIYTSEDLKRMKKDIEGDRIHLLLNRVPEELVPAVEKTVGEKSFMTIPEDPSMLECSLDLIPGGGEEYTKVVQAFCDRIGFSRKVKKAHGGILQTEGKDEKPSKLRSFLSFAMKKK
jgi:hypothetical protein